MNSSDGKTISSYWDGPQTLMGKDIKALKCALSAFARDHSSLLNEEYCAALRSSHLMPSSWIDKSLHCYSQIHNDHVFLEAEFQNPFRFNVDERQNTSAYSYFFQAVHHKKKFSICSDRHDKQALAPGVGATKPISSVPLFSQFVKTHVSYWISHW